MHTSIFATTRVRLCNWIHDAGARLRRPIACRFQPYTHTLPDRYPWLFHFAAQAITAPTPKLLSFGCSRGEEVLALNRHFPRATIRGLDINPGAIAQARRRTAGLDNVGFAIAQDTLGEPAQAYDAIFALAVLCHGDLANTLPASCAPLMRFAAFEAVIGDFARCLKPCGYLFLHTCNFRFRDAAAARGFETVLWAPADAMAPDRHYDRDNLLIDAPPDRAVGFHKRGGDV